MERRDALKWLTVLGATALLDLDAAAQSLARATAPLSPDPVNAAHVESVQPQTLADVYLAAAHAEAARSIHAEAAKRLLGREIPVSLVVADGVTTPAEQLPLLQSLDVMSISTGIAAEGFEKYMLAYNSRDYKDFWKNTHVIGVKSAGNAGNTRQIVPMGSMLDFADTAVSVGEATKTSNGQWAVKDHSQKVGSITFLSPNITDEGFKIPLFIPNPDLSAHKDLIVKFLLREDAERQLQAEHGAEATISHEDLRAKITLLQENVDHLQTVYARTQEFLNNPEPLHQIMGERLRASLATHNVDANGYADHVDGTSFCSPYVAGAFTAAIAHGKQREASGKKSLCPEELIALAVLACEPAECLENGRDNSAKPNGRGLEFTRTTGFGVFTLEKFEQSIKDAYAVLDKTPTLASTPKTVESSPFTRDPGDEESYSLTLPADQDMTVLKMRVEYKCHGKPVPLLELYNPKGERFFLNMTEMHNPERSSMRGAPQKSSWGVTDTLLGEALAGKWTIKPYYIDDPAEKFNPSDLVITVHGVEKGGLVDVMIDKKLGVAPEKSLTPPTIKNRGRG